MNQIFVSQAKWMRIAIDDALHHMGLTEGGPFGACIVKGSEIIAVAHSTVLRERDPTCHAEVNAIRQAARHLHHYDLNECVIYSTTEPCPMCFSAIHWANIRTIVFGTRIADAKLLGFNELDLSNELMKREGHSRVEIVGDFLRDECEQLLKTWRQISKGLAY